MANRIIHIIWAGVIAVALALFCVYILSRISIAILDEAYHDSRVRVCRSPYTGVRVPCDFGH